MQVAGSADQEGRSRRHRGGGDFVFSEQRKLRRAREFYDVELLRKIIA
ncbi:hypothetical protein [Sorangium sp. So ce394]